MDVEVRSTWSPRMDVVGGTNSIVIGTHSWTIVLVSQGCSWSGETKTEFTRV